MNTVTGEKLNLLKHRAINVYGAKNLEYSNRLNKKYVVTLKNGNKIHFGDPRYEDYLTHLDRKRASKIKDKDGNLTYNDPNSANFWSYHLLW